MSIETQVEHLKTLKPNWDGYGAKPLPHELIYQMAAEIEEDEGLVQLVPGSDGSLQAEWHIEGRTAVEYNIGSDGSHSIYVGHVPSPSRESSDELSTLAAKYLGMSMEEMDASILEREPSDGDRLEQDLERVLSRTAYADIKRLAASVLSQDVTKGQE